MKKHKHVNPFALGHIFADWGVKKGLFVEEKTPKSRKLYMNDKHVKKMKHMDFDVNQLTFYEHTGSKIKKASRKNRKT